VILKIKLKMVIKIAQNLWIKNIRTLLNREKIKISEIA
jgi:hypothetical protein